MLKDVFIKDCGLENVALKNIGKIPSKLMSKILKQYKYIDVLTYWYDNEDDPELNNWIDVEGIGYGWLWCGYPKSERLQRKSIRKYAAECLFNEDLWSFAEDGVVYYLYFCDKYVEVVRLSNEFLYW